MIVKSFELNNLKLSNHDFYLFYGENEGLKEETINSLFKKDYSKDLIWGFSEDTIIKNKDLIFKLKDVKIGDYLNKSKVTGIINIDKNFTDHYEYVCNNGYKIYASESALVNESGKWIRVYKSKYSKKME